MTMTSSLFAIASNHQIILDPSNAPTIEEASRIYFSEYGVRHRRRRLLLWGTCQMACYVWALNQTSLASDYDIVLLGQNYRISGLDEVTIQKELDRIKALITGDDIIIVTPVMQQNFLGYINLARSFSASHVYSLPYIVNTGSFPLYQTRSGWNISKSMLTHAFVDSVLNSTADFNLRSRYNDSIGILKERDQCQGHLPGMSISDFVIDFMHKERLFFTHNHPLWVVIRYVCGSIGTCLGKDIWDELPKSNSLFDNHYLSRSKQHLFALVNSTITP